MKMKKETGITLVSLVVTIIILIILAGISINILVGDNGVITKAQQAKENTLLAQEEEAKQLNQLYSQLNYIGGNAGDIDGDAVDKLLSFKKVIAVAITNEGVSTQETDSAEVMASHIGKIVQERTRDATATADDITEGKTAWVNGSKVIGTVKEAKEKNFYLVNPAIISYSQTVLGNSAGIILEETNIRWSPLTFRVTLNGWWYSYGTVEFCFNDVIAKENVGTLVAEVIPNSEIGYFEIRIYNTDKTKILKSVTKHFTSDELNKNNILELDFSEIEEDFKVAFVVSVPNSGPSSNQGWRLGGVSPKAIYIK